VKLTCESNRARNAMAYEAFRYVLATECALEAIASTKGDSIAVLDVMTAINWSPSSWNRFRRCVRNDSDFQLGLADAGFIDEDRGRVGSSALRPRTTGRWSA
jgi:hypothetical protein